MDWWLWGIANHQIHALVPWPQRWRQSPTRSLPPLARQEGFEDDEFSKALFVSNKHNRKFKINLDHNDDDNSTNKYTHTHHTWRKNESIYSICFFKMLPQGVLANVSTMASTIAGKVKLERPKNTLSSSAERILARPTINQSLSEAGWKITKRNAAIHPIIFPIRKQTLIQHYQQRNTIFKIFTESATATSFQEHWPNVKWVLQIIQAEGDHITSDCHENGHDNGDDGEWNEQQD